MPLPTSFDSCTVAEVLPAEQGTCFAAVMQYEACLNDFLPKQQVATYMRDGCNVSVCGCVAFVRCLL